MRFGLRVILALTFFVPSGLSLAQVNKPVKKVPSRTSPKPAPKKRAPRKIPLQKALIGPEGATIYRKPDFDSEAVTHLPPGMEVVISKKARPGLGGLGLFYIIRLDKKKIAYVVDTEVVPKFKTAPPDLSGGGESQPQSTGQVNPEFEVMNEELERERLQLKTIYQTRYLGGGLGLVDYSEKFGSKIYNSKEMLFALRMTGPGWLSDVLPLDWNLSFSLKPPKFYNALTVTPATGVYLMTDVNLMLPFVEADDLLIHYGFGPMLTYTEFSVLGATDFLNSKELRFGVSFHGGVAYRWDHWALRLDGKYYYEVTRYFGVGVTLQKQY